MLKSNNLLNDNEILEILHNSCHSKNVSILKWKLTGKEGELLGFLGDHFTLNIEAQVDDVTVTKKFFVKSLPNVVQQSELLKVFFEKEAKIYSGLLSKMPKAMTKWTPESYFTRNDILVLEDLSLEHYHLMPPHYNFSKEHVQLVLKSLATMHANSFYLEKQILKKPIDEDFGDILFEASVYEKNDWFMTGIAAIKTIAMKRSRFTKDPKIVHWIQDNFDTAIKKVFRICDNFPKEFTKVFCHRDIWRNNLMYKFEMNKIEVNYEKPLECALIDYQIARYMPPAADVVMTLYMLQRINETKEGFQENVKYYYDQLEKACKHLNMEQFLTFKELTETCDYFKLLGVVLKCIFLQMTHLPDGEIDKIHEDNDIRTQFILVDRSEFLLKYIDTRGRGLLLVFNR